MSGGGNDTVGVKWLLVFSDCFRIIWQICISIENDAHWWKYCSRDVYI